MSLHTPLDSNLIPVITTLPQAHSITLYLIPLDFDWKHCILLLTRVSKISSIDPLKIVGAFPQFSSLCLCRQ